MADKLVDIFCLETTETLPKKWHVLQIWHRSSMRSTQTPWLRMHKTRGGAASSSDNVHTTNSTQCVACTHCNRPGLYHRYYVWLRLASQTLTPRSVYFGKSSGRGSGPTAHALLDACTEKPAKSNWFSTFSFDGEHQLPKIPQMRQLFTG